MKLRIQIDKGNIYDSAEQYGLIYMSSDTIFGASHRAFEEVTYPEVEGSNISPKTIAEVSTQKFKFAVKTDGDLISLDNANKKIISFNSLLYIQQGDVKTMKRITIYDDYRGVKFAGYPMPISKAETFWRDSHGNQGDFAVVEFELRVNKPSECNFNI